MLYCMKEVYLLDKVKLKRFFWTKDFLSPNPIRSWYVVFVAKKHLDIFSSVPRTPAASVHCTLL